MVMADVVGVVDSTGSTIFDTVLTVCLYLGAAFQLICIFSVIILPEKEEEIADDAVCCELQFVINTVVYVLTCLYLSMMG